jgi:hypothetical protein
MNDGVKILLERMKTHPEEFVDELSLQGSKWSGLLSYYNNVLTTEEQHAIQSGMLAIKRDAFTKNVMERLLDEPVQIDPQTYTFNTAGRHAWQSPTLISNTATSKSLLQMQEEQLAQIKEIMKTELQQATKKRSK